MSPWKRDTPARVTEGLVVAHEQKKVSRWLRDDLAMFDGHPWQVRAVTGQDPLTDDEEDQ